MNNWDPFENGASIGEISAEGGVTLQDEEHPLGARITLKRDADHVAVCCSLYGWISHTRFFGGLPDAERDYAAMKLELEKLLELLGPAEADPLDGWEAISDFVRRFP